MCTFVNLHMLFQSKQFIVSDNIYFVYLFSGNAMILQPGVKRGGKLGEMWWGGVGVQIVIFISCKTNNKTKLLLLVFCLLFLQRACVN